MPAPTTDVVDLKNIGPTSGTWLHEAGLHTYADLQEVGAVLAFKIVQHQRPGVSVVLLYALQGALDDVAFQALDPALKARLRAELQDELDVRPG